MEQMRMKHNETGRTMTEMLGVLAIMGVLSLTAIAGITYAMRRQAVVDTVDLINKSSAGILTSGFLKEGTEDEEELPEGMVDSEQIPLNVYMSNVTLTSAAEKTKYGDETFVGPRGSVISAYPSAIQGGGFLLAVNNMQSAVCEDVLSYDLEYDAVVRVDNDGQPFGDFVDATNLDDAPKRKDFCRLGEDEEALNVGFVFNKISPDDDGSNQPKCNEACSVAALGECGLTKTEACAERQYYDLDHCACLCLDPLNMDSDCKCQNNLVWDGNTKKCVQCLDNSRCSGNTPVCNGDTNTCEACPNGEVWDTNDKTCRAPKEGDSCQSNTDCGNMICTPINYWEPSQNGVQKFSRTCCPVDKPIWNGSTCTNAIQINKPYRSGAGAAQSNGANTHDIVRFGMYPFDYTFSCPSIYIDDRYYYSIGAAAEIRVGSSAMYYNINLNVPTGKSLYIRIENTKNKWAAQSGWHTNSPATCTITPK